jgi:pilus assembly protein CpaC
MLNYKNNNKMQSLVLSVLCLCAFLIGSLSIAQADKSNVRALGKVRSPNVLVMLGKAEMINIGADVADVLVADPSIVDVMAVKSNRLYVVGSNLGDTNIMVLDANGDVIRKINIHVQMDTQRLQTMIGELYPNEFVEIRALTDQVVLTGEVSNPSVASKITRLVGRYAADAQGITGASVEQLDKIVVNMMGVRGEQQVMLRVKIVEVSRSALKDLGLESNSLSGGGIGDVAAGFATATALGLASPAQLGVAALSYSSGDFGNLNFLARALEQEGILNTLAEPTLTAISGEQAGFLAGGEFPIPTQLDDNGNLVYEFKPFGVSLNFRPVVMSERRISLQLTTEVSTVSFDRNLQLNGINVPTFNVRRAETTVELPSGGTLMIAGLIQSDTISGLTQLPGIGDVPVIGDLIKSDTFKRNESEIIVMITPYLVKPFAQNRSAQASHPMPVSMQPAFTQEGPDMNYGAMVPDDAFLPYAPERQENQAPVFFADNLRRVYGEKNFNKLPLESKNLGYMLD